MTKKITAVALALMLFSVGCSTNQNEPSQSLDEKIAETEEKLEGLNERFERLNVKLDQLIDVMAENQEDNN